MWELDITEGDDYPTSAGVDKDGLTHIYQDTSPDTLEAQSIYLSPTQMRKIVDRYCNLTGYYPSPD